MDNLTIEGRVQCQSCIAVIDVGIHLPDHNATEHDNAIKKESLDELLVDYGWLPTSKGSYCPRHAREAGVRFRHP
jgi:hypothetical protein